MKVISLKPRESKRAANILTSLLKSNLKFRDRCIALYWMARIKAEKKDLKAAKEYLIEFTKMIKSRKRDKTGFRKLVSKIVDDLIANDKYLKAL